jgi:TolA-binding protein
MRSVPRVLAAALLAAALALPAGPALAQMDSREGIALQNQILQLRQELELLRRGGGGGSALGAPVPAAPRGGAATTQGASGELLGQLLDRVGTLEEEVRRLRGRAEEAEFRSRTLEQNLEKLQGDMDYRMQQIEGGAGGGRQGSAAPTSPSTPRQPATPAPAQPAVAPGAAARTPERSLADGQAALQRRDYAAAEAAAREVLASRSSARAQDANLLLGDALAGRRDFQNAALAYDEAYRRNRQSTRAPEALIGLANAFAGFGARREACDTLGQLRSEFPRLSTTLGSRADEIRRRAQCR